MLQINDKLAIPDAELTYTFVRSSGPGGQNVNKVSTAVRLRFDVSGSSSLPAEVKERLAKLAGSRMTSAGELLIEANRFRTQGANRQDAVERLVELIRQATRRPRRRIATRPTAGARRRRLDSKKARGQVKKLRRGEPE